MDQMVIRRLFAGIYEGKKVFITGHTGFKGSWLSFWLTKMGAIVKGYALSPVTNPNHFDLLNLNIESEIGDIRDQNNLEKSIHDFNPDIVFHLAAQPLVRLSYDNPVYTYEVNVIGTIKLFEACRINKVPVIINVTSDKCYENREWIWGYRENDPMGGFDPYSSSKGCAEILTSSYRNSFFNLKHYGTKHKTLLASVRAGNVIGGGDWAMDRLVPDIMRSAANGESVVIRNPNALRPWQHVLESLSGYLLLGQKLLSGCTYFSDGWNFGPSENENMSVLNVTKQLGHDWDKVQIIINENPGDMHEAYMLRLECSKAYTLLNWRPVFDIHQTIKETVNWYKLFYSENLVDTEACLNRYLHLAKKNKICWTEKEY